MSKKNISASQKVDITQKYSGVLNSNVLWSALAMDLVFQLLLQNIGPLLGPLS